MDEIFYSADISESIVHLNEEESGHCIRVLRHRMGDEVFVMDGRGTMLRCQIEEPSPKGCTLKILDSQKDYGRRPYRLILAVCPTKNIDRYEWMAEKATEIGVDEIVPLIGERSERRVFRKDRVERVVLSAAKQSLKACLPAVRDTVSVSGFLRECNSDVRLIAHCEKGLPRTSITEALQGKSGSEICILIGPEGDFSPKEIDEALAAGFIPVHLGPSRLRTETAAIVGATAIYLHYIG